jgi:hypothetical protein
MIVIRRVAVDVPISQALLLQLGYQLDAQEVRRRYNTVAQSGDHALMVAEQDGCVIALCHACARPALDKPPEVIVQAQTGDDPKRYAPIHDGQQHARHVQLRRPRKRCTRLVQGMSADGR